MTGILQFAKLGASPNLCKLHEDFSRDHLQTANMDDADQILDPSGNNLRAWREHRRMTQEELAAAVGTTGAVISLLESGGRKLSTKWLYRLAPALRIQAGFIVDYDPNKIDTSTLELIETVSAITEEERPMALKVLSSFKKTA
jgi:transcriptional regulator with XRE-family HTH domain